MQKRTYDLEERFVNYTCRMIDVVEALPEYRAGNYIAGQLIKSCHSPTFNYSEAQAVESSQDFIQNGGRFKRVERMQSGKKIIRKKEIIKPMNRLEKVFHETEELVAIIANRMPP